MNTRSLASLGRRSLKSFFAPIYEDEGDAKHNERERDARRTPHLKYHRREEREQDVRSIQREFEAAVTLANIALEQFARAVSPQAQET